MLQQKIPFGFGNWHLRAVGYEEVAAFLLHSNDWLNDLYDRLISYIRLLPCVLLTLAIMPFSELNQLTVMKPSTLYKIAILTLMSGSVLAQVRIYSPGRVAERSVENRANSRVDQEINRGLDKVEEGIGNIFKKKKKAPNDQKPADDQQNNTQQSGNNNDAANTNGA